MEAHLIEFAGMLLRWLHVIAGIAWVGSFEGLLRRALLARRVPADGTKELALRQKPLRARDAGGTTRSPDGAGPSRTIRRYFAA